MTFTVQGEVVRVPAGAAARHTHSLEGAPPGPWPCWKGCPSTCALRRNLPQNWPRWAPRVPVYRPPQPRVQNLLDYSVQREPPPPPRAPPCRSLAHHRRPSLLNVCKTFQGKVMPFPGLSPLPAEPLYAPLRAELTAQSFMLWKHLKLRACGSGEMPLPMGFPGELRCSQLKSGAGPGCSGGRGNDTSMLSQAAQGGQWSVTGPPSGPEISKPVY